MRSTSVRQSWPPSAGSPLKLVQRRRLLRASHLIGNTSLSIEAIASRVGYQDGTALRKLVRREFGVTPAALRG